MKTQEVLYLSRRDVEAVNLSMKEVIASLEKMFREKSEGRVEMPPKPGIHTHPDAFIHAMPAHIPSMGSAGMKWVSGYPENQKKGLPYISGLLILNDPETGIPIAVMDCTWLTAERTGAATAVAAKHLARKDSSTVGIIAAGVQGRSNLKALSCVLPIRKVKVFDLHAEVAQRYAKEMAKALSLEIEVAKEVREAVKDMDVVVTSGPILKHPKPVIEAGWLKKGGFASLVDFDSYWQGTAMREADVIVTDDRGQFDYYREVGYFQQTPKPHAELSEVVSGKKKGRTGDEQRTMAINLGIALDDMAVAILIYRKALEEKRGVMLPL